MKRLLCAVALLAVTATSAAADGPTYFGLQVATGTADLATEFGTGFSSAYDHSEYGLKLELWKMMSSDYAFTISGGIGTFSEENEPGTNATPGDGKFTYSQSSWNFRFGGDRVVKLSDRAILFFGPGFEWWSGKAKFEDDTPPPQTYESESASRFSLHGRIGGHMLVSENWGFTMQVGQKVGRASVEEAGAKSTWWPSSTDGSLGLVFQFGGD
jgi:opacity protein-like surface antigen